MLMSYVVEFLLYSAIHFDNIDNRSMKSRILATYPDAFSDDSKQEVLDQRPDLEMPR